MLLRLGCPLRLELWDHWGCSLFGCALELFPWWDALRRWHWSSPLGGLDGSLPCIVRMDLPNCHGDGGISIFVSELFENGFDQLLGMQHGSPRKGVCRNPPMVDERTSERLSSCRGDKAPTGAAKRWSFLLFPRWNLQILTEFSIYTD